MSSTSQQDVPLAGVERDRLKVGIERGRAGDRVPVVVVAADNRVDVDKVLPVGECARPHVRAHVQAMFGLVERAAGREL